MLGGSPENNMALPDGASQPQLENFHVAGSTATRRRIPLGREQSSVLWGVIALLLVIVCFQLWTGVSRPQATSAEALNVTASLGAPPDFAGRWTLDETGR
jgi:type II secretory pathway component PulM